MASGMVRSATAEVQEESDGLDSPKSSDLVSFCKNFLSKVINGDKEMELFDKFSHTLVGVLKASFDKIPPEIKLTDAKYEKVWSYFHQQSFSFATVVERFFSFN